VLEDASHFLDVVRENDDPLHAPHLDLRECQVVLVVLGDPDVDEVALSSNADAGRLEVELVGGAFWYRFSAFSCHYTDLGSILEGIHYF